MRNRLITGALAAALVAAGCGTNGVAPSPGAVAGEGGVASGGDLVAPDAGTTFGTETTADAGDAEGPLPPAPGATYTLQALSPANELGAAVQAVSSDDAFGFRANDGDANTYWAETGAAATDGNAFVRLNLAANRNHVQGVRLTVGPHASIPNVNCTVTVQVRRSGTTGFVDVVTGYAVNTATKQTFDIDFQTTNATAPFVLEDVAAVRVVLNDADANRLANTLVYETDPIGVVQPGLPGDPLAVSSVNTSSDAGAAPNLIDAVLNRFFTYWAGTLADAEDDDRVNATFNLAQYSRLRSLRIGVRPNLNVLSSMGFVLRVRVRKTDGTWVLASEDWITGGVQTINKNYVSSNPSITGLDINAVRLVAIDPTTGSGVDLANTLFADVQLSGVPAPATTFPPQPGEPEPCDPLAVQAVTTSSDQGSAGNWVDDNPNTYWAPTAADTADYSARASFNLVEPAANVKWFSFLVGPNPNVTPFPMSFTALVELRDAVTGQWYATGSPIAVNGATQWVQQNLKVTNPALYGRVVDRVRITMTDDNPYQLANTLFREIDFCGFAADAVAGQFSLNNPLDSYHRWTGSVQVYKRNPDAGGLTGELSFEDHGTSPPDRWKGQVASAIFDQGTLNGGRGRATITGALSRKQPFQTGPFTAAGTYRAVYRDNNPPGWAIDQVSFERDANGPSTLPGLAFLIPFMNIGSGKIDVITNNP